MSFRALFIIFLSVMLLIAAIGFWAMVDGAATYRNRPMIGDYAAEPDTLSRAEYLPFA